MSKWISIKDRPPKKGIFNKIIVLLGDEPTLGYLKEYWSTNRKVWRVIVIAEGGGDSYYLEEREVTFEAINCWMPLPGSTVKKQIKSYIRCKVGENEVCVK